MTTSTYKTMVDGKRHGVDGLYAGAVYLRDGRHTGDSDGVYEAGRLVAFYCSVRMRVIATSRATQAERAIVTDVMPVAGAPELCSDCGWPVHDGRCTLAVAAA